MGCPGSRWCVDQMRYAVFTGAVQDDCCALWLIVVVGRVEVEVEVEVEGGGGGEVEVEVEVECAPTPRWIQSINFDSSHHPRPTHHAPPHPRDGDTLLHNTSTIPSKMAPCLQPSTHRHGPSKGRDQAYVPHADAGSGNGLSLRPGRSPTPCTQARRRIG